jgi:predicted phage terminase large subunit-like protein
MRNLAPPEEKVLKPQPGPQEQFMACPADIAFYGGAAFGGKSFAICLEMARWTDIEGYKAVCFRRTCPEITNPGGLWDTASQMYFELGAKPKQASLEWEFSSGAKVKFAHMQHETDKLSWQGSAIPLICFDELTHFSKGMFFYMLSRNRLDRPMPIKPYIRATMNPDSASWVAEFIAWWIDDKTGLPIPERSGVVRWFSRFGDSIEWDDSKEALESRGFEDAKSFTFISAKITDNPIGMHNDPGYLSNLKALSLLERSQLLDGNWKIRPTAGMIFKREWFRIVEAAPAEGRTVRYWDRAATEVTRGSTDPDWTAGVKIRESNGVYYVLDVRHLRGTPETVQRAMRACADQDGESCEVWAEEDPGQAGKADIITLSKLFPDRQFYCNRVTTNKVTRSLPASAQAEIGNIRFVRGQWNEAFLQELDQFADWDQVDKTSRPTKKPHDDQVDAFTGGYNMLVMGGGPSVA